MMSAIYFQMIHKNRHLYIEMYLYKVAVGKCEQLVSLGEGMRSSLYYSWDFSVVSKLCKLKSL